LKKPREKGMMRIVPVSILAVDKVDKSNRTAIMFNGIIAYLNNWIAEGRFKKNEVNFYIQRV